MTSVMLRHPYIRYRLVSQAIRIFPRAHAWRDRVPSSVCQKNVFSCGWSLMNFTSVACHVTLGSNVAKLHSALE